MIMLMREMLNSNLECPYCPGKKMFTNGCGGKGSKAVNALLNTLPSSDLFYGACCAHDVLYALVVKGPVKICHNTEFYKMTNRKDVDDFWLMLMLELANTQSWWIKPVMKWSANRNYKFVRKYGASFFKHDH